MRHKPRLLLRLATTSVAVLIAAAIMLPLASAAATFRHKVNSALQSADPDVSNLILSPDGSKVYFTTDYVEAAYPEWYSVSSAGGAATLLAQDGPEYDTEITSDGAYLVGENANDLVALSTATGTVTTLVAPTGFINDWEISPDGKWVVYEDDNVLYVVAVTGGAVTTITPTPGPHPYLSSWRILPDSSAVVFLYHPDTLDNTVLYAYPLPPGTGSRVELSDPASTAYSDIAVAPDSSRVVYYQDSRIHSIKPDGTGRTTISDSTTTLDTLIVSPDSTLVYWSVSFYDEIHKSSLTSNTDTSLITGGSVVPDYSCELGITPDGNQLIFFGDDGSRIDLYSLPAAGGTPVRINGASPSSEPSDSLSTTSYVISPNSQRILYLCDSDNSGSIELMSGKIDGTGATRLNRESLSAQDWTSSFSHYGFQYIARFLPDSSYVIYSLDEAVSGKTEIFAIHPNGTGRTKLNAAVSTGSEAYLEDLADDGTLLVYSGDHNNDGGVEPWVVTLPAFAASQLVDLTDTLLEVSRVCAPDDGDTLFYSAYQDSPRNAELYAVPYAAGTPVKVNSALPAGRYLAMDIEAAPGAAHVVYDMYEYGSGYRSDYGASDGSGSSVMVHDNTINRRFTTDGSAVFFLAESTTVSGQILLYRQYLAGGPAVQLSPALFDVVSFELSADDTTLVMLATNAAGVQELYSLPAAGGAPVKLNPALVAGGWVRSFAISPDSAKVVFFADAITIGSYMLFSIPLAGGSETVIDSPSGSSNVGELAISPDSATVVFLGDRDTAGVHELFAVPIGGGTRVKLNSALVANGDVSYYDDFVITSDSARVIYLADGDTDEITELYSAKLDGSSAVKLNGTLVAGGEVSSFKVSADGTWAAYYADQTTDGTYELFHVAITGGTARRLHPIISSPRQIGYDYQIIGSDHVIFSGDITGAAGQVRLYSTKVPEFSTTRIDNNSLAAGDVWSFAAPASGAYISYLADQTTDGSRELYVVYGVPDITPVPNQLGVMNVPLGPVPFTVSDLETSSYSLAITAVSSNPALVSDSGISFGGSGSARTLTLTPNPGQWGLTSITVTVSDGIHQAVMSFEARFTPDPNDPPGGVNLAPHEIPENAPVGTLVGMLNTLDPDLWDYHTYTLVGGATTEFGIIGDQLRTNNVFDYETTPSLNIIVRTTDFCGAFYDQNITVNVLDLSGQPTPFGLVGPVNQRFILNDGQFRSNFILHDGPSLERIRIETEPTHGHLVMRFPEELIDGTIAGPRSIVSGDLNGDGRADLVVAAASGGTNLLVWYQQMAGVPSFPVPAGLHVIDAGAMIGHINDVAAADLDRDGDLDLVVTCGAPVNTVYLYQNMGGSPPVFVRAILTTVPNNPRSVCVGKIDADPEWDIVVASSGDNMVRVFRRNGAVPGLVYFAADVASAAEPGVSEIALADFDKDGRLDIACADPTSNEAVWLRNNGGMPPVFARRVAAIVPGASSVATGDLNKDTFTDLVVASQTGNLINWLQSDGGAPPLFVIRPLSATFNMPLGLAVADVDGDSDQDVVAVSGSDNKVVLFDNPGSPVPVFNPLDIDRDCGGASCVFAGDLTNDGKCDLVSGAGTANDLSWYPNSMVVIAGTEIDIDETQKLFYQPNAGFVGIDTFDWRGHDGVQWSFDAATVTFSVYGTEYWNWLVANFTLPVVLNPAKRATVWGSTADPDHDGLNNITEYALNGNPNSVSSRSGLTTEIRPDSGLNYLFATYPVRKNETNLSYTLEVSTDLTIWNSGGGYFSHVTPDTMIDAHFDQVTYKVLTDVDSEPRQFVCLKIQWALD